MKLKRGLLLFIFLLASSIVSAQNLSGYDFKNTKVDELSDNQISRINDEIQSRGLTIDQAIQLAKAKGMSQAQATKLKSRLQQVGTNPTSKKEGTTSGRMRTAKPDSSRLNPSNQNKGVADSMRPKEQSLGSRIFGYNLFSKNVINFEPSLNIPTPEDYQLGPGDGLYIDIWGAAQSNYQLQVSPDGMVIIPNIGPVKVSGLTIDEATNLLKKRLSSIYSGLNPPNKKNKDTYMQLSLGQTRSIKVTVLGEALIPGTYTVSALSTAFNVLYAAGGPKTSGSFRKIKIISGDSTIAILDLYDLLVEGNQSNNIRLRSGDIIQIPAYQKRVEIGGEVKRPGIYEMKDHETVGDLITFAGDFTENAYTDRVKIIGNTDKQKKVADVQKKSFDDYVLHNGDSVSVGKILDRFSNKIQIQGAVYRPGEYALTDSTSLYSLINRADGLKGDAFMNRGIIYRTRDDYTIESISFSVRKLMRNPQKYDIPLKKDDVVKISSIFDMRENYTININGPVQKPDTYKYVYGMTLEDLIYQAGGFEQSADPLRIEVSRRIRELKNDTASASSSIADIYTFKVDENLNLEKKGADFELQPFDRVYVRQLPNYEKQQEVYVVGELKYPGKYTISSRNERISDIIERAGGLTSEAYTKGATLFRKQEFTRQKSQQSLANIEGLSQEEQKKQVERQGNIQHSAQVGINLPEVLKHPNSKYDLFLEEGDSLFIPKQLQTVSVKGGVFYPTTVRYENGFSFKDYITSAGGFTDLAKKRRAYIIYASGKVDRVKSFLFFKNFPSVQPGATIIVPEKPEPRKLSPQERVGIYSTIVSTAALITTTIVQITR